MKALVLSVRGAVSRKVGAVALMVFVLALSAFSAAAQATPAPLFPSASEVLSDSTGFLGELGVMPLVVAGAIIGLAVIVVRKLRSATR